MNGLILKKPYLNIKICFVFFIFQNGLILENIKWRAWLKTAHFSNVLYHDFVIFSFSSNPCSGCRLASDTFRKLSLNGGASFDLRHICYTTLCYNVVFKLLVVSNNFWFSSNFKIPLIRKICIFELKRKCWKILSNN